MIADDIAAYYRAMGERSRLTNGAGRLEFLRTWDVMVRTLPPAPASILDVGGATGVYAQPLAAAGYSVHVVDPVAEHVLDAAELAGVTASVGEARSLGFESETFDAVLLFGPLYHLQDRSDRVRAWAEAGRVIRPDGVVIGAVISRYASFLDGIGGGFASDLRFRDIVRRDLATGRHDNPDRVPGWFTTAYFQHPAELPHEVADAQLTLERMVPVEFAVGFLRRDSAEMFDDPEVVEWMLDLMRQMEDDPIVLGASPHVLAIARRARLGR